MRLKKIKNNLVRSWIIYVPLFLLCLFTLAFSLLLYSPPKSNAQTTFSFEQEIIDATNLLYQRSIGDINGDGQTDIVGISESDGGIVVYLAPDFETNKHLLVDFSQFGDYQLHRADDLEVSDIDNDGDLDVVDHLGSSDDDGVTVWFENNGSLNNWQRHDIGFNAYVKDIKIIDVQGDGNLDVVTREHSVTQIWYQQNDGSWIEKEILHTGHEGMDVGDIDGDGDIDVVLNGYWLETPSDVLNGTYIIHTIDDKWFTGQGGQPFYIQYAAKVSVTDIDGDGNNDVVISHSEIQNGAFPVAWYSSSNPKTGNSGSWDEHIIIPSCDGCHNLQVADFDGDDDTDVLFGSMPGYGQYQGLFIAVNDGNQSWTINEVHNFGSYSAEIGDINDDGDIDIVGIRNHESSNGLPTEIWRNLTESSPLSLTSFSNGIEIDNSRESQYFGLWASSAEGDKNIVSGRYFYKNPGSDMTDIWTRTTLPPISNSDVYADALLMTDVDGDSFEDVIGMTSEGLVYWFEALDESGSQWNFIQIGNVIEGDHSISTQGYALADIVSGGKLEIVLAGGLTYYYFEIPQNPENGDWPMTRIAQNSNGEGIGIGDIDGDGQIDLAMDHGQGTGEIKWVKNPGDGSADWTEYVLVQGINGSFPDRNAVADVDGDGDLDIITSQEGQSTEAIYDTHWFENPGNPTNLNWTRHTIATQHTTNSMDIADMDLDGDIDVVTGEHRGDEGLIIWENDGTGLFTSHLVEAGKENHLGARLFDMDGDGDLDIIGIAWDSYPNMYLWRNDAINNNGGGNPPTNNTPVVNAGSDASIILPDNTVNLQGVVSDDGLPTSSVSTLWTVVSATGTVIFVDDTSPTTNVSFDSEGNYILQLTADDGELTSNDQVLITVLPESVEPTGLIGLWNFEDGNGSNASDSSSSGNTLSINGATWSLGKIGGGISFDGSGSVDRTDNQLIGKFPSRSTGDGEDFTLASWVKLNNITQRNPIMSKQGENASGQSVRGLVMIVESDGTFGTELFKNNSSSTDLFTTQSLNKDQWYHLALTYDFVSDGNSIAKLYIDGQEVASTNNAVGPLSANTVPWRLGRYQWANWLGWSLDGTLDEARVYDNALSSGEIVSLLNSSPVNQSPIINAGNDQSVVLPTNTINLSGTASDDGLPSGSTLTTTWSQTAGPATVTFGDENALNTTATFPEDGIYTLRITADDGLLQSTDDVVVTVEVESIEQNNAPVVDAGSDQVINLPSNSANLSGIVSDDELPVGSVLSSTWSDVNGSGLAIFDDVNSLQTTATFASAGVYTLQLEVSDTELTTIDTVLVRVNSVPTAFDQNLVTDEDTPFSFNLIASDSDNDNLSYVVVSQPILGSISLTGNSVVYTPNTNVNGLDAFTYEVTDGYSTSNIATVNIDVNSINDNPNAVISINPVNGIAPLNVIFDANSSTDVDGNIVTYLWDLGDGSTLSSSNGNHTYNDVGTYTVVLTVTDDLGAIDTMSVDVNASAPSQGLIGHWDFEEGVGSIVNDDSGLANNLNIFGATWATDQNGGIMQFDGSNDYLRRLDSDLVGGYPAISDGSGEDFTVAAWVKFDASGERRPVVSKQGNATRGFVMIAETNNTFGIELFKDSSNSTEVFSSQTLQSGQWYHLAVSYDYVSDGSSVVNVYINGQLAASNNQAVGPINSNTVPFELGRYAWNNSWLSWYMEGSLDDVFIFDRSLSDLEIVDLMIQ